MKTITLLLGIIISNYAVAQMKMSAQEKSLREQTNFSSFIENVSKNDKKGCLCRENEYVVFSFSNAAGKTASLCISQTIDLNTGYMVYRFGTSKYIELTYPSDTLNSLSKFSHSSYYRGGGRQNAAMSLTSVYFTNNGFVYELFDDWDSEDDRKHRGIMIRETKSGKTFSIDAAGKVTGRLSLFSNEPIIALIPRPEME